jgi:hypothetical protein
MGTVEWSWKHRCFVECLSTTSMQTVIQCNKANYFHGKQSQWRKLEHRQTMICIEFPGSFFQDKSLQDIQELLSLLQQSANSSLTLTASCPPSMPRSLFFNQMHNFTLPEVHARHSSALQGLVEQLSPQLLPHQVFVQYINPTKGFGLFSNQNLERGKLIAIYFGEFISRRDAIARYTEYDKQVHLND